jgi:hypothetical protein
LYRTTEQIKAELPARFAAPTTASARAATAASVVTATATGSTPWFARLCFIHFHGATIEFRAVERLYCTIRFRIHRHLNECETPRLPRLSVLNDLHAIDLTVCGECRTQILFRSLERDVPDVNVLQTLLS